MTTIKKQAKSTVTLVIFLIVLCSGSTSEAVEKTWTGEIDPNWSNGDNWSDGNEPNSFSDVIIPDANTTTYDPTIDAICYCKNITIKSGGILNGGSNVLDVSGNWTNNGTFNAGTGGVIFTGSGDSTIAGTNATAFYNLRVQKADTNSVFLATDNCSSLYQTWVDSGTLDFSIADVTFTCNDKIEFSDGGLSSKLTMDACDVLDLEGSIVFNSGATEDITGGTIYVGSDWDTDNDVSFTPSGGVVVFYGSPGSDINCMDVLSGFYDLEVNKSPGISATAKTDIAVSGNFTITSGIFDTNGFGLSVAGDWTNNDTLDPDSSKVTFNGTSTIDSGGTGAGKAFYNVELNGTSATLSTNDIDIDGDFTITSGTWNANGFGMYVAGSWTNNGTFTHGNGTVTFDGTGTIGGAVVDTFYFLNVADSGQTTTLSKNITVDNDFTIGDGTYNGAFTTTLTWHLDYPIVVSPGATIINGTIELAPTADFYGFGTYISSNLNNLKINSPTYTVTMTDDVNCNGNLDVLEGMLSTGSGHKIGIGGHITIDGTLTAADPQSDISCQGDWTNNGTFNPGSGTVTFTGSGSLISGGTSAGCFYGLRVSSGTRDVTTNSVKVNGQLTINSGAAFQIATGGLDLHTGQTVDLDGTLSLEPSSGSGDIYWYVNEGTSVDVDSGGILALDGFDDSNRVYLRSSADGNQWYLNDNTSSGSNPLINYVDVKDSDASFGNTIIASDGTNIDSGNNLNWNFTPVIFVDADAPAPGPGDGSSWYDAYKYLQDALAEADSASKPLEIWVAQQTYTPDTNFVNQAGSGDRKAAFQLISGVDIYGGFPSGGGSWEQRKPQLYDTTLSGDLDGNDVQGLDPCDLLDHPSRADNSFHVVTANDVNSAVLDGFTIYGGNANGVSADSNGGGLYNVDSNITVLNSSFKGCSASSYGGAWSCKCSAATNTFVFVQCCDFNRNYAKNNGGAIYMMGAGNNYTLTDCIFTGNSASKGGGMYSYECSPTVTNCTFIDNSAVLNGGGMYNEDSNAVVTGCTFTENSAANRGGGMANEGCSPTVTNCTLSGNSAGDAGGMYCYGSDANVINCTFSGNSATNDGGGIGTAGHNSTATLANCTFSGNDANNEGGVLCRLGGSADVIITNCILWGNTSSNVVSKEFEQIYWGPGLTINYSCVEGWTGSWGGTGNIGDDPNDDPDFAREPNDGGDGWGVGNNDDYGDLHLVPGWPGSPCIDTGDNSSIPADTADLDGDGNTTEPTPWDIDGDVRVSDSTVDMGSDEVIWDGATGISPDANVILNPGGGPNDPNTEALVLFDNNSAGDANIIVVEMSSPVYPSEGYFQVLGTTLRIDTTLSDGEFSAIIVIPFDGSDLAGADPCKLNLMYYDAVSEAWKLAVAGNTGGIGTRWLELAPSDPPPTWETLEERALGDYGTYWEPSTSKGLVSAIVDHFTDFSPAGHDIPDFEPDGDVDFVDFVFFAEWWQESGCGICGGVELTGDGSVGFDDLRELADNWLAGK